MNYTKTLCLFGLVFNQTVASCKPYLSDKVRWTIEKTLFEYQKTKSYIALFIIRLLISCQYTPYQSNTLNIKYVLRRLAREETKQKTTTKEYQKEVYECLCVGLFLDFSLFGETT
jgi:hypothetical protein